MRRLGSGSTFVNDRAFEFLERFWMFDLAPVYRGGRSWWVVK